MNAAIQTNSINALINASQTKRIICDQRLAGRERWVLFTSERLMEIPDDLLKCVVFLAWKDGPSEHRYKGTAGVISCPLFENVESSIDDNENNIDYLVTARHVIEGDIKRQPPDGRIYVRFNLKNGGSRLIETLVSDWFFHDDNRVDVAVLPLPEWDDDFDHLSLARDGAVLSPDQTSPPIHVGSSLFFPGLFAKHPGTSNNLPIVRFGNIAGMPSEAVSTPNGQMNAILIEARSIGGLSGSPVMVVPGFNNLQQMWSGLKFHILGLIHGHYDDRTSSDAANDNHEQDGAGADMRGINSGIGIVVPAKYIVEVLDSPVLVAQRTAQASEITQRRLEEKTTTPD